MKAAEKKMKESVSQMIRERIKNDGKQTIQDSYNPTLKNHIDVKKWKKDKIPTMYDIIRKKAMSTPSPNKYSQHDKLKVPRFYAGFSKVKKVTYIDEIMAKKKKVPGPSSYKPNYPKSKCKLYTSKAVAGNAFIDDATFRGMQTPGIQNVKYGSVEKN
mmetsp:Transcript_25494/g.28319  ORF Transcript_25494/g.28319 Transcript_25494/m.28319 type:complete len:158 (+) Transcript_25494:165-638(+)